MKMLYQNACNLISLDLTAFGLLTVSFEAIKPSLTPSSFILQEMASFYSRVLTLVLPDQTTLIFMSAVLEVASRALQKL